MNTSHKWIVVLLLLLSGLCALVYQVGWLRELRLIFGGSTVATSIVLTIFMGGLGFGGLYWGRIADRFQNPFRLYAYLEVGIALFAALSPFLLSLVRYIYIALGGTMTMGTTLALIARFVASATVLGVPTFLMGGTLPAMARAIETNTDKGRRNLALLYAFNTIGGVGGVIIATFFLLELVGTRLTIWYGALLNIVVGCIALVLSFRFIPAQSKVQQEMANNFGFKSEAPSLPKSVITLPPPASVYTISFLTGFSFFIMEIVWNRMLTPLLGGSVYSFGLIIGVVLSGIGIGGWLYSGGDKRFISTVNLLVITLILEALALAVPFALGDRLAVLASLLWPFGSLGFGMQVAGWAIVTSCIVLPASVVAGFQFPLLVNLLGSGRQDVGKHTGKVYAWNTFGAISGLLAGGLGLMSLLSAPGCWIAVVLTLSLSGAIVCVWCFVRQKEKILPGIAAVGICTTLVLITANGPTAAWRHSPIGVGNVNLTGKNRNEIRDWSSSKQRQIIWDVDGRESSIGLSAYDGLAFFVNGKADGNSSRDAGTQVMGPLISAILHPQPTKALVIGLGTGSSGGWLAQIDSIEQVDVMELEPAMLEVARRCSPVNHNVLENPKINVIFGDARETLMTSQEKYDIIFSEPSNPYRAGISSLYTQEFYQAVHEKLKPGGYFSQWVQAYEVDGETLNIITATLASVFQGVEIWQTKTRDFVFVCSDKKSEMSIPGLKERLSSEPFKTAMMISWGVNDLEGFLATKLSGPDFARVIKNQLSEKGLINSDDKMLVEFGFARGASKILKPPAVEFRWSLMDKDKLKPIWGKTIEGIDWKRVNSSYSVIFPSLVDELIAIGDRSPELGYWQIIYSSFLRKDYPTIINIWKSGYWKPEHPFSYAIVAEALAESGDFSAMKWADEISARLPVEAKVILGRYFWRKGETEKAYNVLEDAFVDYRKNPWPLEYIMRHALDLVGEMSLMDKDIALRFFELLKTPFSVYNFEEYRLFTLLTISSNLDCKYAVELFGFMEPNVPFKENVLQYRQNCYEITGNPLLSKAQQDLKEFQQELQIPFTANSEEQ